MTQNPAMSAPTAASCSQPRDASPFVRWFVALLSWHLILTVTLQADEISTPSSTEDPLTQRQELLTERNELILSANRFYQEQKYDEAMQRLQQLVALYQQIYPISEYPNGHRTIVACYVDICRVADRQHAYDEMLNMGLEGIRLCRRLATTGTEYRDRDFHLAVLLSDVGTAHFERGEYSLAVARIRESVSVVMNSAADGQSSCSSLLPCAMTNLGTVLMAQGDFTNAAEWFQKAVQDHQRTLKEKRLSASYMPLARCLHCYGQSLRKLGQPLIALSQLQESYDTSLRLYILMQSDECHLQLIDTMIEIGNAHMDVGDRSAARAVLTQVKSRIMRLEEASVGNRLQLVLSRLLELSHLEESREEASEYAGLLISTLSSSGSERRDLLDEFAKADALLQLGIFKAERGDFAAAEQVLSEARTIYAGEISKDVTPEPLPRTVMVTLQFGNLFHKTGRFEEAHIEYCESLRLARQLFSRDRYPRGHPLLSSVIQNSATHCWLIGETDLAAGLYREVLDMNETLYPVDEYPRGHLNLQHAFSAWANLLVLEGRFDEAEIYVKTACDMLTEWYPPQSCPRGRDDLAASWIDLGRLRRARGDFSAAKELFDRALQSYESRGCGEFAGGRMSIALALAELGRTYAAEGDFSTALAYHRRSLGIWQELFPPASFPMGHPRLANSLRDVGITCLDAKEPAEAFRTLAQSVTMEHAIGESFFGGGSEAQLLNFAARKFQSFGPLLRAWQQTGLPAQEVYPYVWMRHGLVARLIADRQRLLRELARENQPAIYQQYVAARQDLSRALLVSVTDDVAGDNQRRDWLQQLNAVKENLEHELTRGLPANESERSAVADIQALAAALPETAAFVDFFSFSSVPFDATVPSRADPRAAERIVAFVICRDTPVTCVDLGESGDIAALVAAWKEALLADADDTVGAKLRQTVWDPVRLCLPERIDAVYIAPDGVLGSIAWGALPDSADAKVLLERYAFATVPHGPFLLDQLRKPPSDPVAYTPVLAVGDVDYGNRDGDVSTIRQGLNGLRWEKLPGSRHELQAIVSGMADQEVVLLTGMDATTENVLHRLATARVAHFATHGFFIDDALGSMVALAAAGSKADELTVNRVRSSVLGRSPLLRSGLALAGANNATATNELGIPSAATGILTAETVSAIDAGHLQLVVMSACDTSRGDAATGEGVLGIQGAFHIAGARNVIAGLWKVPDEATADLMGEFYRLLGQEHKTPLVALREAQLHMMRQTGSPWTGPRGVNLDVTVPLDVRPAGDEGRKTVCRIRDWAGFVLSGPGF